MGDWTRERPPTPDPFYDDELSGVFFWMYGTAWPLSLCEQFPALKRAEIMLVKIEHTDEDGAHALVLWPAHGLKIPWRRIPRATMFMEVPIPDAPHDPERLGSWPEPPRAQAGTGEE